MDKLTSPQFGCLCVISEAQYDEMAKKKIYGIPTYVTLKDGYAYVYPFPANVMDLERELERLSNKKSIRENIITVLDRVPKYYKADVGDRISNIYDIADAIMAELEPGEGLSNG